MTDDDLVLLLLDAGLDPARRHEPGYPGVVRPDCWWPRCARADCYTRGYCDHDEDDEAS